MPIQISHRGNTRGPGSPYAPRENTIEAFDTAIKAGAQMIEFDVRFTADGHAIIHHDPSIQQDSIKNIPLLQLQSKYPYIPTLELAITHCKDKVQLDIEIKESYDESSLLNLVIKHLSIEEFVITSFKPEVLAKIKAENSAVQTGLLLKPNGCDQLNSLSTSTQTIIKQLQPDFLAPHYSLMNSSWLQKVNSTEKNYWVWTVNTNKDFQLISNMTNVTGIISDYVPLSSYV